MLQAAKKNKLKTVALVVCLLCVLSVSVAVAAAFLNTNRDTRPAPDKVVSDMKVTNAYQLLCEKGDYQYYFRDDRDIILVKNIKTGYIWKTGVDIPLNSQIEEAFDVVNSAKEDNDPGEIKDYADSMEMTVKQVKELANTPKEFAVELHKINTEVTTFENKEDEIKEAQMTSTEHMQTLYLQLSTTQAQEKV